jgi:N utilization substance protein B
VAARSKARKRALDILYEAEMRGEPALSVLEARTISAEPPVSAYAIELVQGIQAHRAEIDRLLAENSRGWALDRMPAVDRNILRIGCYEILWGADIPDAVAISEAVLLAGDLSTDASSAFVNGLLARLLEIKPELSRAAAPDAPERPDSSAELPDSGGEPPGDAAQQSGDAAKPPGDAVQRPI